MQNCRVLSKTAGRSNLVRTFKEVNLVLISHSSSCFKKAYDKEDDTPFVY